MCSTHADEDRFIGIINDAIAAGDLSLTPLWTKSSTSKPAKLARARKAEKESKEAEEYAKELGIHDQLYPEPGSKAAKAKGKGKVNEDGVDEDALKAMIMAKQGGREQRMDAMLVGLEAKYGAQEKKKAAAKGKGKKRVSQAAESGDEEAASGKGKKKKVEVEPTEEECEPKLGVQQ